MCIFFFKQKTAYEMRISDWSSDVCSSDLSTAGEGRLVVAGLAVLVDEVGALVVLLFAVVVRLLRDLLVVVIVVVAVAHGRFAGIGAHAAAGRQQSEHSGAQP